MSIDDDDLESRLRSALTTPRPQDRVDSAELLERVHRGARVRRTRRSVAVAAATALAVVSGAAAINAGGFLDTSSTPAAGRPQGGPTSRTGLPSDPTTAPPGRTAPTDLPPPTTQAAGRASRSKSAKTPPGSPSVTDPVTIAAAGPIAAAEVRPVSLTATGTAHQWVLAQTPGRDCGARTCATVFSTPDHGLSWADLGQLPAPPASTDSPTPASVSQLRITKRDDGSGTYDGWAYGDALWSTHDSGRTWSAAGAPAGRVTQLEAWGGYAYAGVSSSTPGDDTAILYRSPTTTDDWQPVDLGARLTSVQALAAANGVVGLIDSGGLHSALYLSPDGQTWQRQHACPGGTDPRSLSTAGDGTSGVGALWVACGNATTTLVRYTDTTALGVWHDVKAGAFGAAVLLAARDPSTALVSGAGIRGIEQVSASAPTLAVYGGPIGVPVYFGFTNPMYGYLLSSDGSILSSTDGGTTWTPYAVSDTSP